MNEFLKVAIENTKRMIPSHWDTLLGERPAGSQWGREFTEADFALAWVDKTDTLPASVKQEGCVYLNLSGAQVHEHFPAANVGAIPLNLLSEAELEKVRIRNGAHGPELVIESSDFVDSDGRYPVEAWVIIGKHDGEDVVFTAHPGPVMKPLPAKALEDLFTAPYAVKVL